MASGALLCWPLGDTVTVVGADAGLHVGVWLNRVPRAQEDALIARVLAAGIGL
jgi:GntR family transcriptional regulator / MocR family aminotransferase